MRVVLLLLLSIRDLGKNFLPETFGILSYTKTENDIYCSAVEQLWKSREFSRNGTLTL